MKNQYNDQIYVSKEVYEFLRELVNYSQKNCNSDTILPLTMLRCFLYAENELFSDVIKDYLVFNDEVEFYIVGNDDISKKKVNRKNANRKKQNRIPEKIRTVEVNCIENDNVRIINMTESVFDVIIYALELVETYEEIEEVTLDVLTIAFVQKLPTECGKILRQCNVSVKELKEDITIQNVISKQIIPKELRAFLTDLSLKANTQEPCQILGRDDESDKLWDILLKKEKANAVLVGKPGVGKTAIVEKIAYEIACNSCPKEFENFHVISLSVNSIIAGTIYRGEAEQNFDELIKYIEDNQDIILFIDEIHTILGAGSNKEGEMDLSNALKPVLARGKSKVIGGTTIDEYEKYFSKDGALKRRFKKILVEEPEIDEVYPMIKNKIAILQEFHDVKISREMVDECILYATCFDYQTANPDRTLDVIDVSMSKAKRHGNKEVSKEDILSTFNMNFKALKRMSEEDIEAIAYHEAGHFVVSTFCENVKDEETIAISIVPADNYLGVNATNHLRYKQVTHTSEYLEEYIAIYLGGRIGEYYKTYKYDAGAANDLEKATKIAKDYISKYGLCEDFAVNRILFGEDETISSSLSEESKLKYENAIDDLIKKCYKKAWLIIENHHALLEKIAKRLKRSYILNKEELDEIVKDYKKSKNLIS